MDTLFDFILNSNKKLQQKSNKNSHLHHFSDQRVHRVPKNVHLLFFNNFVKN